MGWEGLAPVLSALVSAPVALPPVPALVAVGASLHGAWEVGVDRVQGSNEAPGTAG